MNIRIQYYAILREAAGRSDETVETGAATAADLYGELAKRHGFTAARDHMKVVVNEDFVAWDHALAEGDTVVFIPPVAGG